MLDDWTIYTWYCLNCKADDWEWDNRLGEKPDGWDKMPRYHIRGLKGIKTMFKPARSGYLKPVFKYINCFVPEYDLLLYSNMKRGISKEEFNEWWTRERPRFLL